ncbi:BAG domain-containing protein [Trichoderma velutinum]
MDSARHSRHFAKRKIPSATPSSSAASPTISSSSMQTGPGVQWISQSRGARGMAGVQNRSTISKDKIQGNEQRMADLLAHHGNKVMRSQHMVLDPDPIDSGSNSKDSNSGSSDDEMIIVDEPRNDTTSPWPQISPAFISAAMKTLDDISDDFHTNWLPLCLRFIESPPKDAKKRDEEHRKLSESVMRHIVLKLDSVETEGVDEIRQRRKDLVRRVQEVLKQLDVAKAS